MTTEAQNRAVKKYQAAAYDRIVSLTPKGTADLIRRTGRPVSGYAAEAILEKLAREDAQKRPGGPEDGRQDHGRIEERRTENAPRSAQGTPDGIWIDPETVAQLQPYGDPAEIIRARLEEIIEEYHAGIR